MKADVNEDGGPWEVSQVECDLCGHNWTVVRPENTERLECPNCGNTTWFENK
jgi:transposase